MKTYDQCPESVHDLVRSIVARHHSELQVAEVKFDLLFIARSDDDDGEKPVLTLHGVPCPAVARIVSGKNRAKGNGDAEILIDRERFTESTPAQQEALLDHELQHFEVLKDKEGGYKTDDQHRPRLRLRHHDYDFGWFECIARRHGAASVEVQQARSLVDQSGQSFWPFLGEEFGEEGASGRPGEGETENPYHSKVTLPVGMMSKVKAFAAVLKKNGATMEVVTHEGD